MTSTYFNHKIGRNGDNQAVRAAAHSPFGLVLLKAACVPSTKDHQKYFQQLQVVVVDEWHELLGTKRGVQVELAVAYLRSFLPHLKVWGISATLGNKALAQEILLGKGTNHQTVEAQIQKKIKVQSLLPKSMERFPGEGIWGWVTTSSTSHHKKK